MADRLGISKGDPVWVGRGADATPAPVARAVADLPTGGPQGGWDHPDLLCAVPAGILVDGDRRLVRGSGPRRGARRLWRGHPASAADLPAVDPTALLVPLRLDRALRRRDGRDRAALLGDDIYHARRVPEVSLRGRFAAALRVDRVVMFVG